MKETVLILGAHLSPSVAESLEAFAAKHKVRTVPASMENFKSTEPGIEFFPQEGSALDLDGRDVVIAQSCADDVSEACMQLLLTVMAAKRFGARTVTVVMPFAPFGRQDRVFDGRYVSVAGMDFPFLLAKAGVSKIITAEMHSKAAENFYNLLLGNNNVVFTSMAEAMAEHAVNRLKLNGENAVIGSPDGADKPEDAGQKRAKRFTQAFLQLQGQGKKDKTPSMFFIGKKHIADTKTTITSFTGDVAEKTAIVVDDMTDSGGTLKNAAERLKAEGAAQVVCYITHAIFPGDSLARVFDRVDSSGSPVIDRLVVSDTIPSIHEKIAALPPALAARVDVVSSGAPLTQDLTNLLIKPEVKPRKLRKIRLANVP